MNIIKSIAEDIEGNIEQASAGKIIIPTVLFCGCNPQLKKIIHKLAKQLGLNPPYSIKHPTNKVGLKNNKKIEIYRYRTISIDYEHFEIICRYLES